MAKTILIMMAFGIIPNRYYINDEYAVHVTHPPVQRVEWVFEDGQWVPETEGDVELIRLNCRTLSHHYNVEIISHQEFLTVLVANWLDPYDYWDFYMLSHYWNGSGRLQLQTAADLLRKSWL